RSGSESAQPPVFPGCGGRLWNSLSRSQTASLTSRPRLTPASGMLSLLAAFCRLWMLSSPPTRRWPQVESAAIHGGVADVLALHDVDDVLGDVGGMVADAFEIFCGENQLKRGKYDARIPHHVSQQFAEDLIAVMVHLI